MLRDFLVFDPELMSQSVNDPNKLYIIITSFLYAKYYYPIRIIDLHLPLTV